MNIIKSDLVDIKYDAFWEDVAAITIEAGPKSVLVVINDHEQGSQEQVQLQKMLEACKLTPAQYNIVKVKTGQLVAWHKLRELLDPKVVFLFGILPAQLGISALFRLNEPNRFNDRIWLPSISIAEQEQFPDLKKQLWVSGMKPVFIDKAFGEF